MENFNVLIVDDEKDFLKLLYIKLTRNNLKVFCAASGQESLELLAKNQVDVVVLDLNMPDMNGLETLTAIKKSQPLVEVIMLTGYADIESGIKGMELGAFDYLIKPVSIDDLLHKLQDAYIKKELEQEKMKYFPKIVDIQKEKE